MKHWIPAPESECRTDFGSVLGVSLDIGEWIEWASTHAPSNCSAKPLNHSNSANFGPVATRAKIMPFRNQPKNIQTSIAKRKGIRDSERTGTLFTKSNKSGNEYYKYFDP